jgi:hypothetical protein
VAFNYSDYILSSIVGEGNVGVSTVVSIDILTPHKADRKAVAHCEKGIVEMVQLLRFFVFKISKVYDGEWLNI